MQHNYLLSLLDGPFDRLRSTIMLKEKWTGAMLDQTGRAYSGAIRLDFSPTCIYEKVLDAVADTLARYPILASCFKYENDTVVGYAPKECDLHKAIRDQLSIKNEEITDELFLNYRARNASDLGLRLASSQDDSGLKIWIGFWIFTCDGASIDLIVDEISKRYNGTFILSSTLPWNDYVSSDDNILDHAQSIDSITDIYSDGGPYGIDQIRATPNTFKGRMESYPFQTNVLRKMLSNASKVYRVTPFILLFAAYQQAISTISEVKNVVTGVPFLNRRTPLDYTVVGPLSNTIPISTKHELNGLTKESIKSIQYSVIKATKRQHVESSVLYPKGISPRTAPYQLPYPQLFNAWNSQSAFSKLSLGETGWMTANLLPNDTYRIGFEMTLNEQEEYISGRIDMDKDAYDGKAQLIIDYMTEELNRFCHISI